ncbi:MAG: hypothetical protein IJ761_03760 [Bacteroidales bacterium]|nr:hypothetical protein [Bacteroidales bacterium]
MRFHSLEALPNRGDRLIEGHCVTLDGHIFRIFVMEELTVSKRGYILKLMLDWGDSATVDLDKQGNQYPQAKRIFDSYLAGAWMNKGTRYHCYKYIVFGHGEFNRELALTLLHHIVEEIEEGGVQ